MYQIILLVVLLWMMCEGRHFVRGTTTVTDPKCLISDCECCIDRKCADLGNFPNECFNGCIDGHRGARCYELCQNNCKTCPAQTTLCGSCYDQFYLSQGKHCRSCPVNCQTCTSNTWCTSCKEGFENGYGSVCEYSICPANCNCDNSNCYSCKNGYYDVTSSCTRLCPPNCLTCRSLTECNDCIEGYYNGYKTVNGIEILLNDCTHKCRETCKICSSYDQCQQCQTGKYGNVCQYNCSLGCMDNSCDQVSGKCLCRSNFIGEKCEKCQTSKYGNYCNKQCPIYCKNNECDKVSGECTQGCATTDFIGFKCENCTIGKYGEHCNVTCPMNCNNEICDRTSGDCTNGCKGNFMGKHCTECIYGKYGSGCNLDCPDNCLNKQCDKQSGNCLQCAGNFAGIKCDSCIPGFYGDKCIQNCSRNCLHHTCNIVSGICAYGCEDNFYGDRCCVESKNCLNCLSNTECGGCVAGFYGTSCNKACPPNCKQSCDFEFGVCDGCTNDYYGSFCNFSCSEFCAFSEDTNGSRCDVSGVCTFGCILGHFGSTCNMTCSSYCSGNVCEQSRGICTQGCSGQYDGSICSSKTVGPQPSPSFVGPVVGGIAAVILIIAGVVAALLFYRRRHRRQDSDHSNVNHNRKPLEKKTEIAGTTGDGRVYENIQGKKQPRHTVNKEQEEVDVTAITIDDRSEPNGSEDYDYTSVKVTNLFSYVTKDHVGLFVKDFQTLLKPDDLSILCKVAKKPENIASNRYNGIYPFDHSRVIIPGDPKFFINACYIDGYNRSKAYIASLGPTIKHTENFTTFWQMVWHEKSDIIVMLTNLREASGMKCEQYWPEMETEMCYGRINVKCRSLEEFAEYTVRCFTISKGKEERNLTQLHYTAWPDKGVPSEVTSLVDFRQRVKAAPVVLDGPVIVHCSAGVGRTGTYIALDILTEKGKAEHSVDVFNCVNKMREQRVNMVQTAEQYIFLHKALVHTLTFECEALTAEELQSLSFENDGTFKKMYQTLKHEVDIDPEEEIAATEENRKKYADKSRRHSDIPGNRGRVRLYLHRKSGNHDYINAVFINSFKIKNLFIAAQTPQSNTVEDFLCMIYQQNCSCVVSLEDPLQQSKKHDIGIYLPADNETFKYGDFTVTSSKFENKPQCSIKKLAIKHTNKGEEKIAYHFQYTKWGHDQKVADSPGDFVQFVKDVEKYVNQREADMPNVVVHCSNGYERSGLFCVVYKLLEKLEAEGQVSVVNVIRKVRTQRKLSISSVEQLKFCFQCISAYLESYNTYSNFAV